MVFLWLVLYWVVGVIAVFGLATLYYYRLERRGYDAGLLMKLTVAEYCAYVDSLSAIGTIIYGLGDLALFIAAWPVKIVWFYFAWVLPAKKDYEELLDSEEEEALS